LDDLGIDFMNLKEFVGFSNIPLAVWNKKSDKKVKAKVRRTLIAAYFRFTVVMKRLQMNQ
jgi:hypothetical protein